MAELLDRISLVGLVAGVGAQLGCAPEEVDECVGVTFDPPPELEPVGTTVREGRWLSATTLELQFTAPISGEGLDPDPTRFGVLGFSVIAYDQYESCYVRTLYNWLGSIGYYYNYSNAISMGVDLVWIPPEDDTLLRLRIATTETCPLPLNVNSGEQIGSGVLLIYEGTHAGAGSRLLDAQGDPLDDIGVQWALELVDLCIDSAGPGYFACGVNGAAPDQLPRLSSLLEIPCP